MVGLKSAGVQAPAFRSKVSVLLGAPVINMKMQFLALPMSFGSIAGLARTSAPSAGKRKYPVTPAPAILKKLRRPSVGPVRGEFAARSGEFTARSGLQTSHTCPCLL